MELKRICPSAVFLLALCLGPLGCIESNPQPSPLGDDTSIEQPEEDVVLKDLMPGGDQVDWADTKPESDWIGDAISGATCDSVDCGSNGTCYMYGELPYCVCDPGWVNSTSQLCVPLPEGQWCSLDGWCFESPRLPAYTLLSLHCPERGVVWAAGERGVVLKGQGANGTIEFLPGQGEVLDLVGFGAEYAMAVRSDGSYSEWKEGAWHTGTIESAKNLATVGGTGPTDLWTAYSGWEGDEWNYEYQSHAYRWNGITWSEASVPGNGFKVVAFEAGQDQSLYLGGQSVHQLSDTQPPSSQMALYQWSGEAWETVDGTVMDERELVAMQVVTQNEIWLATQDAAATFEEQTLNGRLYLYSGGILKEVQAFPGVYLISLLALESGAAWLVTGPGEVARCTIDGCQKYVLSEQAGVAIRALAGTASDDIWATGSGGALFHWDGALWTGYQTLSEFAEWNALAGTASDDVWAVGGIQSSWAGNKAQSMHWDGSSWSFVAMEWPPTLAAAWAFASDDVWAVGGDADSGESTVAHWDGLSWQFSALANSGYLNGVWGASSDEIWAVGSGAGGAAGLSKAAVLRYEQGQWTPFKQVDQAMLFGTWGLAQNDAWAWGSQGSGEALALHWDGEDWTEVPVGVTGLVLDISGASPDDLWALVYWCNPDNECGGRVLRWDGLVWTQVWESLDGAVNSMAFHNNSDVWVFGTYTTYHWDGTSWAQSSAVWPSLNGPLVIGDTLRAAGSNAIVRKELSSTP